MLTLSKALAAARQPELPLELLTALVPRRALQLEQVLRIFFLPLALALALDLALDLALALDLDLDLALDLALDLDLDLDLAQGQLNGLFLDSTKVSGP